MQLTSLKQKSEMKKIATILLILTFSYQFLVSQTKTYTTNRISDELKIDGIFDDNVWNKGEWLNEFTQHRPDNGAQPSQKTEFSILYDDNYIYVGVRAYDSDPDKIDKRMSRRDGWDGDRIRVYVGSYNDKRTAFHFCVNAGGVKSDGIGSDDGNNFDDTWDPIWFVKTQMTEYGWNAEMKIPLSQLRFSSKTDQTWDLQVGRYIFRKQETNFWQHIPEKASGWVSLFGELKGLKNIKPKRQVELAPYIMSKVDFYEKEDGNPFADGRDFGFEAGVDGKIGITNDLTLDFAINPDFGQVEADPSEVNLSAFESYFREKRLFFVEGSNITNYKLTPGGNPWSSDNLFYSRRIGRSPHGDPELDDGEYVKMPNNTRILGALKLTGKTKNGWSIGILESFTNKEKAKIDNNGEKRKEVVEPYTNYFLGRVQKDINKGNTIIGGMLTSTYRDLADYDLEPFLIKSATSGGIDFTQYFKERKYYISAKVAGSHVLGSKEAIVDQQRSSRRYYQRPDVGYVTLDSSRTSLTGHGGTISFGKRSNSGLRYSFVTTWRSSGYETNDMGYMRRANSVFQYVWAGYNFSKPFSVFNRMNVNLNQWSIWDMGGIMNLFGGNINMWAQFKNFWSFNASVNCEGREIDNTALRGGPSLYSPGHISYNFNINTNNTKKFRFNMGTWQNFGFQNSRKNISVWAGIRYRPVNSLSISLYPDYDYSKRNLQYVTTDEYNNEDRYIFGEIERRTVNLTVRIDYSITSDLTIQFYGSPYISSGLYSNFKKITDSKADEYSDRYQFYTGDEIQYDQNDNTYGIFESGGTSADYNFDNPDFNFRQYRSNLVLRWEYSPGSLLYLVWSQGRTSDDSNGKFNYFSDMKNLFKEKGQNVILLKLSFRFRT